MPFDPTHVKVGPGTLYAAPLGTTEPTSVTGAWPAGWTQIGYTDQGSEFDLKPTIQDVTVEEEYWPVAKKTTLWDGSLTFAMAETTRQNWILAVNGGIGSSTVAGISGTNADGSIWAEMPPIGSEVSGVMLGWDALASAGVTGADPFARLIVRQSLQSGQIKRVARKGSNKATYEASFELVKPTGVNPFRWIFPPQLAS